MKDNHPLILGQPNVQFNHVTAGGNGVSKRRQRILRYAFLAAPSVRNVLHAKAGIDSTTRRLYSRCRRCARWVVFVTFSRHSSRLGLSNSALAVITPLGAVKQTGEVVKEQAGDTKGYPKSKQGHDGGGKGH
jgi:hypothetical protein